MMRIRLDRVKATLIALAAVCLAGVEASATSARRDGPVPDFPEVIATSPGVYTPYSWVTLEALNDDRDYSVALAGTRSEELFDQYGEVTAAEGDDCSEVLDIVDFNELLPERRFASIADYVANEGGVISFTVVDTKSGFYFGIPSTMLALKTNWTSRPAEKRFGSAETFVYAIVPQAKVRFGELTLCQRPEGSRARYEPGVRILYFPRWDGRESVLHLHDRQETVVESVDNPSRVHAPAAFLDGYESTLVGMDGIEDYLLARLEISMIAAEETGEDG